MALRDEFNRTGTVRLPVPDLGELVIIGERSVIRDGNHYSVIRPDGTVEYHEDPDIPLTGTVRGVPGSSATLLLGHYAVYGRVIVPGAEYGFHPHFHPDTRTFEQIAKVTYADSGAPRAEFVDHAHA